MLHNEFKRLKHNLTKSFRKGDPEYQRFIEIAGEQCNPVQWEQVLKLKASLEQEAVRAQRELARRLQLV